MPDALHSTPPAPLPPPFLVSWNVTRRCNLGCAHCYLDATELAGKNESTTAEALGIVERIAKFAPGAMLILTGGEPLLRPDIYKLASNASERGLTVVLGTNGTLIDEDVAEKLVHSNVAGVGISIDAATPAFHDRFRNRAGAWSEAMAGIDALRACGIDFQVQFTVTKENRTDIDAVIELALDKGARAVNVFFLVCTGRGQDSTDLTPSEYEDVLKKLARAEAKYRGSMMVRARCAPHFLRVAEEAGEQGGHGETLASGTSGCIAATGYMRVSPTGGVTPCPYIAETPETPNMMKTDIKEIWEGDPLMGSMRSSNLKGRCGVCKYKATCGGCRARALASTGDVMETDPWCEYVPGSPGIHAPEAAASPLWSPEARERLEKVPSFLRRMVESGVERYAATKGISVITPEIMAELKKRAGR